MHTFFLFYFLAGIYVVFLCTTYMERFKW